MGDWRLEAEERIDELAQLEAGWFDGAGLPMSERSIRKAKQSLRLFTERPGIFSDEHGYIRFEWLTPDSHTVLDFCGDGQERFDEFYTFRLGDDD